MAPSDVSQQRVTPSPSTCHCRSVSDLQLPLETGKNSGVFALETLPESCAAFFFSEYHSKVHSSSGPGASPSRGSSSHSEVSLVSGQGVRLCSAVSFFSCLVQPFCPRPSRTLICRNAKKIAGSIATLPGAARHLQCMTKDGKTSGSHFIHCPGRFAAFPQTSNARDCQHPTLDGIKLNLYRYVVQQFAKVLPNDVQGRRSFVQSGGLEQLLVSQLGTSCWDDRLGR